MILISVLLALALDKVMTRASAWQAKPVVAWYLSNVDIKGSVNRKDKWQLRAKLAAPAVLLYLVESWFLGSFFIFLEQTAILYLALGCCHVKQTYKSWIQAANRDDLEACDLYEKQLHFIVRGEEDQDAKPDLGKRTQQLLLQANFQFFAAVLIWFVVFGAPGALFYMVCREANRILAEKKWKSRVYTKQLMHILDWIPARVAGFGFLVVGYFSNALPVWLNVLPLTRQPSTETLWQVAAKAEVIDTSDDHTSEHYLPRDHAQAMVRLAKRNILFLVVLTALFTLLGWLA